MIAVTNGYSFQIFVARVKDTLISNINAYLATVSAFTVYIIVRIEAPNL